MDRIDLGNWVALAKFSNTKGIDMGRMRIDTSIRMYRYGLLVDRYGSQSVSIRKEGVSIRFWQSLRPLDKLISHAFFCVTGDEEGADLKPYVELPEEDDVYYDDYGEWALRVIPYGMALSRAMLVPRKLMCCGASVC